jgi:3-phenylpropionate/trans-cinnamate dioxygenase ferredoxin subunit
MTETKELEWVEAATEEEFAATDRKRIDLGGMKKYGLFKIEESFYAVSAFCTHAQVEMLEGDLEGFELSCPMHGAIFDVRNGEVLAPPAYRELQTFETRVENGKIFIKV